MNFCLPGDMEDTLAESSVAANADPCLVVLFHLTEEARLRTPLSRGEVVQGDTTKNTRFHILDSRSVQTAYHVHPPVLYIYVWNWNGEWEYVIIWHPWNQS